nr:MAG TPA: hypothetical protein [Caudoviricetes sp.]
MTVHSATIVLPPRHRPGTPVFLPGSGSVERR